MLKKKISAILLSVCAAVRLMPLSAFAETTLLIPETQIIDTTGSEKDITDEPEKDIADFESIYITPEEYKELCKAVNKDFGYISGAPTRPQILPGKKFSSTYFYDQMNATQKEFYNNLNALCAEFAEDFTTNLTTNAFNRGVTFNKTTLDLEKAFNTYQIFYYDHPEYYFLANAWKYSYTGDDCVFLPCVEDSFKSAATRTKYDKDIDEAAKKILDGVSALGSVSDVEKEMYIVKALSDQITYKKNSLDQSIAGALADNKCVCNGYTMAMTYLLNAVGIDTIGIRNLNHAWNAVKLDGKWFLTDTTWIDQKSPNSGYYNWTWFNKSTSVFQENDTNYWHSNDYSSYEAAGVKLPACEYDMSVDNNDKLVVDSSGKPVISEKKDTPSSSTTGGTGNIYEDKTKAKTIDEVTVWANGGTVKKDDGSKVNYKTATCFADIQLAPVTVKNTSKTGKLTAVVTSSAEMPRYSNGKFDKDSAAAAIVSASVKADGTLTINGGKTAGKAYVWVFDLKADKTLGAYARVGVNVKAAPKKISFEDNLGEAVKGSNITLGEMASFNIVGELDGKERAKDATYSVSVDNKLAESINASVTGTRVTVSAKSISSSAKSGKALDAKITVTCNESGKKATYSLSVVNPIVSIKTEISSGTKLAEAKDTVDIKVTENGKVTGQAVTAAAKVFVCTTKPYVDSKSGKVTTTTHTAKYKDGTLTLTCKNPGEAKVYLAYTSGKETVLLLAATIAEDGTVTCV